MLQYVATAVMRIGVGFPFLDHLEARFVDKNRIQERGTLLTDLLFKRESGAVNGSPNTQEWGPGLVQRSQRELGLSPLIHARTPGLAKLRIEDVQRHKVTEFGRSHLGQVDQPAGARSHELRCANVSRPRNCISRPPGQPGG